MKLAKHIHIKNDLNDKLFRCIKVIKQFPVKELTEKSEEIKTLLFQIVNVPGARDEIINILKSKLEVRRNKSRSLQDIVLRFK